MTRAQIHIFSKLQNIDFLYGVNSDGYPSFVASPLMKFSGDIPSINEYLYLTISPAGNFDYYYELDCDVPSLTYGEAQIYWRNAPPDWKERGWHCWIDDKHDNYGWSEFRKGKILDILPIHSDPISIKISSNNRYTLQDIKSYIALNSYASWTLKRVLRSSKNLDIIHTYIQGDDVIHNYMYDIPYEDIPLYISDDDTSDIGNSIYKWRLNVGK